MQRGSASERGEKEKEETKLILEVFCKSSILTSEIYFSEKTLRSTISLMT